MWNLENAKKVSNSWNWTFYQRQNWKYLQISILLKFPNVSEVCIIYRSFKGQKSYKTAKCWSQAFYRCKNRITLNNAEVSIITPAVQNLVGCMSPLGKFFVVEENTNLDLRGGEILLSNSHLQSGKPNI